MIQNTLTSWSGLLLNRRPLAFRQGVVHGPSAMRRPPFREGSQCASVTGDLASWQMAAHQGYLCSGYSCGTAPDSACGAQGLACATGFPLYDPVLPGNGVPRSTSFSCGKSITYLTMYVKRHASPRTSWSNCSKNVTMKVWRSSASLRALCVTRRSLILDSLIWYSWTGVCSWRVAWLSW